MATSASSYTARKRKKITDESMEHVLACGVIYGRYEKIIAIKLFVKPTKREMFITFPTEYRFNQRSRKYITKYSNQRGTWVCYDLYHQFVSFISLCEIIYSLFL